MSIQAVLLPLFVEVVLTFVLLFWTGGARFAAVRRGEVRPRDVALREPSWPKHETQIANSYQSRLKLPVLFYVLTILAMIMRHADLLFVVLAWVFVLSRLGARLYPPDRQSPGASLPGLLRRLDRARRDVAHLHPAHSARIL